MSSKQHFFRGIEHGFETISYEEIRYMTNFIIDEEDKVYLEKHKDICEIVVNKEKKQSVVFMEYRYEDETYLDNPIDIINTLADYNIFKTIMNKLSNVTFFISQVEYTSADFVIIFDKYITNLDDCKKIYDEARKNGDPTAVHYKYQIIKDGKLSTLS